MKATDQYLLCYCLLCTIVYKVVLTFESKDEILKFGHSDKSYGAVVSCSAFLCCIRWLYEPGCHLMSGPILAVL